MRLATDLSFWAKIDDIWVSYVLDALLGWEIRRTDTLPVDIGAFLLQKGSYRHKKHRLSENITKELLKLQDISDITEVATWKDPSVNKTKMFLTLQKDFMWDIESHHPTIYRHPDLSGS